MDDKRITIGINDLLPPKRAAEYLGVTTMTLWRWRRDGIIAVIMLDRPYFHINELNRIKVLREEQNKKAAGGDPAA